MVLRIRDEFVEADDPFLPLRRRHREADEYGASVFFFAPHDRHEDRLFRHGRHGFDFERDSARPPERLARLQDEFRIDPAVAVLREFHIEANCPFLFIIGRRHVSGGVVPPPFRVADCFERHCFSRCDAFPEQEYRDMEAADRLSVECSGKFHSAVKLFFRNVRCEEQRQLDFSHCRNRDAFRKAPGMASRNGDGSALRRVGEVVRLKREPAGLSRQVDTAAPAAENEISRKIGAQDDRAVVFRRLHRISSGYRGRMRWSEAGESSDVSRVTGRGESQPPPGGRSLRRRSEEIPDCEGAVLRRDRERAFVQFL